MKQDLAPSGSWRTLFGRPHLPVVVVLAGGVGLYAMNLYFTAALMPSVVHDLGGARYFAWASTGYLITAVIATVLVGRFLRSRGPARSYLIAYTVFALGTALGAVSPTMELFVAGRAVQGFGAGLLTGLGYAVIRSVLPAGLWTRATGLVSAMFGVGALVGPAAGGAFAELDAWRLAFAMLVALALALVVLTVRALPGAAPARSGPGAAVPVLPILALALTAAVMSIGSTATGALVPVCIGLGIALLATFLVLDARTPNGVLPRSTYARGNPLKWVYLTVAALCAGVMTENFIPLFGQELAGLTPLLAGFLGAALSFGWVVAQLFSVNASPTTAPGLVRLAPWLLAGGLGGYGLLQFAGAGAGVVIAWTVLLFIAGAGIGLAFPHLSVAAMSSSADEGEGAKAAAAVSTTQLIAYTLTSAIAGNLLALGGEDMAASARWVVLGIAALVFLGTATAFAATRRTT
ncbi:MFS transporter [Nocardia puris]|uniref:MFS transporter n=1 Tax=Nocardia puris TaxID=208602 RepID=A0A366DDX7_9NOCA|nr:MFS transporter [Nocardia puris]